MNVRRMQGESIRRVCMCVCVWGGGEDRGGGRVVWDGDAVRQQHRRPRLADRWDVVNQQSDLYTLTLLCRRLAEG